MKMYAMISHIWQSVNYFINIYFFGGRGDFVITIDVRVLYVIISKTMCVGVGV